MSNEPKKPYDPESEDAPKTPEDQVYAEQERQRRAAEADLEVEIIDAVRGDKANPVQPIRLSNAASFCFSCHKGVSCWNECCHDTDIMLTPYDILRLAKHFDARPGTITRMFAAPSVHDGSGMPVVKLKMVDKEGKKKPCVFLDEVEGCTVYKDRPAACRYYPLGLAAVKLKGHDEPEDFYFLVKEDHCKGHDEPHEQTVGDYRAEQGVEEYDQKNRDWIHILMKLASWKFLGGPWGKEPDERTKKMFFMATTDIDQFRMFVFNSTFLEKYAIEREMREELAMNDEVLLKLAFDWLRHVLFNEPTISLRPEVLQQAIAGARGGTGTT